MDQLVRGEAALCGLIFIRDTESENAYRQSEEECFDALERRM